MIYEFVDRIEVEYVQLSLGWDTYRVFKNGTVLREDIDANYHLYWSNFLINTSEDCTIDVNFLTQLRHAAYPEIY
jgi:hypothetical protein